jgi:hypothetical protein
MQQVVDRLLAFLAQDGCTEAQYDAMALELFAFQHAHNAPLRRFCAGRGITPRRVAGWRDIPAVPIGAFKDATLSCIDPQACERVFMTSGTTRGDVKGRNHHPTIAVWDASMQRTFRERFMGDDARLPMLLLFPDEQQLPNSSLARYLTQAARVFGTEGSRSYVGPQGLDVDGVVAALDAAQAAGTPLALLGASFSFVHLLDACDAAGRRWTLPAGSRLLDTGGYKGQARELPLDAFYDRLAATFGVPRGRCINMYGMTELSSQFYDGGNARVPSIKSGGHWIRTRVLDPLTGRELPPGQPGVLAHCDLANFNSTTTILTEDVGVQVEGGFLLLGRAEGAAAKGCSLAVQEFLQAATRP